jgi:cold shock protein
VKFFNTAKGFGFIQADGGGKDIFVHATALEAAGIRALNEGDRVSFVPEDDRKGRGKQAGQLKKLWAKILRSRSNNDGAQSMEAMAVVVMLVIGAIAGWLASLVVGDPWGLIGYIIAGVVGSFLGSWLLGARNLSDHRAAGYAASEISESSRVGKWVHGSWKGSSRKMAVARLGKYLAGCMHYLHAWN